MSTKSTLSYDRDGKLKYHLYQECYESDNVWLQLDDAKEFEVWRDGDRTRVRLAIPVEIFRHAVEGWLNSTWGKNPSMDNVRPSQEDLQRFAEMLRQLAEKHKAG